MQQTTTVLIIVILLTVGIGGYLFWQNSVARSELVVANKQVFDLKETNLKAESELILLKSSDLAKDLELTQFKLKTAERDLVIFQKEAVSFKTELENLRSSLSKIPLYLDAIDTIERMVGEGPSQFGIDRVNSKISALKDSTISAAWENARRSIDLVNRSWSGQLIADTTIAITRNIRNLIAQ